MYWVSYPVEMDLRYTDKLTGGLNTIPLTEARLETAFVRRLVKRACGGTKEYTFKRLPTHMNW